MLEKFVENCIKKYKLFVFSELKYCKDPYITNRIKEYLLESTNNFIKEEDIKLAKFSTFKNSIISINSIFL